MIKILAIANNTFKETIRDKVLRVVLGLSLLVIITSKAIAEISLGQDLKVIADMSLGAIDLFGAVLCIFIGTNLIYKEIDKKTLYTILARPLNRWEFILGKYLGMTFTVFITLLIMSIVFSLFFIANGGKLNWLMLGAVYLIFIGLMFLNSISLFFSTMASPTVSAISTLAIFLAGRASYELKFLADLFRNNKILEKAILGFYYILPNFSHFNIKLAAVHGKFAAVHFMKASSSIFIWATIYSLIYSSFFLFLAILIFKKRNL